MSDIIQWTAGNSYIEQCSPRLRFVERDGRRMLQQAWLVTTDDGINRFDWRDVPLVSETAQ